MFQLTLQSFLPSVLILITGVLYDCMTRVDMDGPEQQQARLIFDDLAKGKPRTKLGALGNRDGEKGCRYLPHMYDNTLGLARRLPKITSFKRIDACTLQ